MDALSKFKAKRQSQLAPGAEGPDSLRKKQLEEWYNYDFHMIAEEKQRQKDIFEEIQRKQLEKIAREDSRKERLELIKNSNYMKKLRNRERKKLRENPGNLKEEELIEACLDGGFSWPMSEDSEYETEAVSDSDGETDPAVTEQLSESENGSQNSSKTQTSLKKKHINFNSDTKFLAHAKCLELVELEKLLENGQNVNATTNNGKTALHIAAIRDNYPMTELVLKYNISVNLRDKNGWTALHFACYGGNVRIANHLVFNGALVDHITNDGELVTDVSENNSLCVLLKGAFSRRGIKNEDDKNKARDREQIVMMDDAVKYKDTESFQKCKQSNSKFFDPKPDDKTGGTILHVAASKGYLDVVKYLVEEINIDLEMSDFEGWTALHAACHWEQGEVIKLLRDAGADILSLNKYDQEPMDVMIDRTKRSFIEVRDWAFQERKLRGSQDSKMKQIVIAKTENSNFEDFTNSNLDSSTPENSIPENSTSENSTLKNLTSEESKCILEPPKPFKTNFVAVSNESPDISVYDGSLDDEAFEESNWSIDDLPEPPPVPSDNTGNHTGHPMALKEAIYINIDLIDEAHSSKPQNSTATHSTDLPRNSRSSSTVPIQNISHLLQVNNVDTSNFAEISEEDGENSPRLNRAFKHKKMKREKQKKYKIRRDSYGRV